MRFLPPEEPITIYETGFDDDLLGRVKVGKSLSSIFERIEDPLVVALDGRWGTGKTYFLKRWVGAHTTQNGGKALTVYFDAFAHDYFSDPLIALVGALAERSPPATASNLKDIKKFAVQIAKPLARMGIAMATAGMSEVLNPIGDAAVASVKADADKSIDAFWRREEDRRAAMENFRSALERLTAKNEADEPTPLVFVVDELDRCRPDYALETLEVIKHFFSVPNVHFLLGVNLGAIENSVKARYGKDIDALSYLQKFLSFSLSLPDHVGDPNWTSITKRYLDHKIENYKFETLFSEELSTQLGYISRSNSISIRELGKIISHCSLLPPDATSDNLYPGWRAPLITIVAARVLQPKLFEKIIHGSAALEDIADFIGAQREKVIYVPNMDIENDPYDRRLSIVYHIWKFILSAGKEFNSEETGDIRSFFGILPSRRNVNKVPERIYEDWLSIYRIE